MEYKLTKINDNYKGEVMEIEFPKIYKKASIEMASRTAQDERFIYNNVQERINNLPIGGEIDEEDEFIEDEQDLEGFEDVLAN